MRQLVVLCGGLGTRMAAVTGGGQKCLVEVAGRPFLGHVLDRAVWSGLEHVLLLAGHRADEVAAFARRWGADRPGLTADVHVDSVPAGPVGALRAARELLDGEFLLAFGDVCPPAGVDVAGALRAVANRTGAEAVVMTGIRENARHAGNIVADGDWVARYDPDHDGPLIDRGVRYLRRSTLDRVAGGGDREFLGTLAARRQLAHLLVDQRIVEVGTPECWAEANTLLTAPARSAAPR